MINLTDRIAARDRTDLARQIMVTIKNFTFARPMSETEVIATLAFCVGLGIGNQPPETGKRGLMQLAGKMLAQGEDTASKQLSTNVIDMEAIRKSN